MKKKLLIVIAVCVLTSMLSGCFGKKELNELAIVIALAVDKVEDKYIVTAQIIDPGEIAGKTFTSRVPFYTYTMEGRTVFEAIRKLTKASPRKSYFSHLRVFVLGENYAKEGIKESLDFISRDHEFRSDFYMVLAKDSNPKDILRVLTPIEKVGGNKIYNSIEASEDNWAPSRGATLKEVIPKLMAKGENPVITGILAKGDIDRGSELESVEKVPPETTLEIANIAAFKDDKFVGWLNTNESGGYNYIRDNVTNTVEVIDYEGTKLTIEVKNSSTDVKAKIINQKPKIIVDVSTEANIGEIHTNFEVLNKDNIQEIEKKLELQLKRMMQESIDRAKELKTDIFGFGEQIRIEDVDFWNEISDTWHDDGFIQLEVELNANFNIRRTGIIGETL